MELSAEQLERLFRNLEQVSSLARSIEVQWEKLDKQDITIKDLSASQGRTEFRLGEVAADITRGREEDATFRKSMLENAHELARISTQVQADLAARLAALEEPVRIERFIKAKRRRQLLFSLTILGSAATAIWVFLDPVYHIIVAWMMRDFVTPHGK